VTGLLTQLPLELQVPPAGQGVPEDWDAKSQVWLAVQTGRRQALALGAGQSLATLHAWHAPSTHWGVVPEHVAPVVHWPEALHCCGALLLQFTRVVSPAQVTERLSEEQA
jgi:hypothetical protein